MSKILVIEDDKFLANAYRVKFDKEGFEVVIATDGEEGLKLAKEFSPDLILLDLVMPKMDGFEFLEAFNKEKHDKKVKIIVASNLGQKSDVDKAKELGADDYIIKSDESIADIVEKVKKVL